MVDCLAETNACFGLVDAFWIGICGLLRPTCKAEVLLGRKARRKVPYFFSWIFLFYKQGTFFFYQK